MQKIVCLLLLINISNILNTFTASESLTIDKIYNDIYYNTIDAESASEKKYMQ